MARVLVLPKKISGVVIEEKHVAFPETKNINIHYVTDTGNEVNACFSFVDGPGETFNIELWGGKTYNATWTDAEVDARLKQTLNIK